jgi:5'-deoxynucleotidase YfbR-like HD superfamily hydrolase
MDRVKALWESGAVRRFHATPILQHYDIAQHCWRMGMLLDVLHPGPSQRLRRAVMFHDSAERWTGDVPATAKWWVVPGIDSWLRQAELRILTTLGVHVDLTNEEHAWLKALDLLELYLFCLDEINLGNTNVTPVATVCRETLRKDWVPQEVHNWMETAVWTRTDDGFGADHT